MTRRTGLRITLGGTLATIAAGIVLGLNVFRAADVVAVYVLALGALALLSLTRPQAAQTEPSLFDAALRRRPDEPHRPPELVRIERELVLGIESAGHLHTRLLPILREAAAARLAAKHHVDLERRPAAARALLGEDVWELLRPDRAAPAALNGPGLPQERLRRVIDVLEAL